MYREFICIYLYTADIWVQQNWKCACSGSYLGGNHESKNSFFKSDYYKILYSRDSSVGIALGYGLDDRDSRARFPAGAGNFSLHRV
jgi:hypothetical protein